VKVVLFPVIFTVSCVKDQNALANLLEVFLLCVGGTTSWELSLPQADLHLWSTRKVTSSAILYSHFPYSSDHGLVNYTRPFTRTNYLFSSFVPSVVSLWNSLPDHVKVSPLSVIKAHVSH